MEPLTVFWFAPACAIIALVFAYLFYMLVAALRWRARRTQELAT